MPDEGRVLKTLPFLHSEASPETFKGSGTFKQILNRRIPWIRNPTPIENPLRLFGVDGFNSLKSLGLNFDGTFLTIEGYRLFKTMFRLGMFYPQDLHTGTKSLSNAW